MDRYEGAGAGCSAGSGERDSRAEHQILREKQQAYLKHVRHEAIQSNPKRLLVIMDFSKFSLKQNITQSTEEKKGKPETVHDMIMVFERKMEK